MFEGSTADDDLVYVETIEPLGIRILTDFVEANTTLIIWAYGSPYYAPLVVHNFTNNSIITVGGYHSNITTTVSNWSQ